MPATSVPGVAAPASGPRRAGEVLLLVGAIFSVLGLAGALFLTLIVQAVSETDTVGRPGDLGSTGLTIVLLALGLAQAVAAVLSLLAWRRARQGAVHRAGILGVLAGLLPPVQLVTLLGAILLLTSPEHAAWKQARTTS